MGEHEAGVRVHGQDDLGGAAGRAAQQHCVSGAEAGAIRKQTRAKRAARAREQIRAKRAVGTYAGSRAGSVCSRFKTHV